MNRIGILFRNRMNDSFNNKKVTELFQNLRLFSSNLKIHKKKKKINF